MQGINTNRHSGITACGRQVSKKSAPLAVAKKTFMNLHQSILLTFLFVPLKVSGWVRP
jgi:hypothetical protein